MHYVLKEIIPWHCSIENRISVMVEWRTEGFGRAYGEPLSSCSPWLRT
jgi:hypothetical protein